MFVHSRVESSMTGCTLARMCICKHMWIHMRGAGATLEYEITPRILQTMVPMAPSAPHSLSHPTCKQAWKQVNVHRRQNGLLDAALFRESFLNKTLDKHDVRHCSQHLILRTRATAHI